MDRQEILEVIRRTAETNGGTPLGTDRLAQVGVTPNEWGKYWARIGDAQREAGLAPNRRQLPRPDDEALAKLVSLARELGTFPTYRDIVVRRGRDRGFPSPRVFRRLGPKARLASRLLDYARTHPGHDDITTLCSPLVTPESPLARPRAVSFGSVYLLRGPGHRYKIGRTNAFGRRRRELSIQLPFDTRKIHVIETDDPDGVEGYWHHRFAAKRINSEWLNWTPMTLPRSNGGSGCDSTALQRARAVRDSGTAWPSQLSLVLEAFRERLDGGERWRC
jgi:hypothetical protein